MLLFEIFKIDWLFIDTVIIIFLLSILLIVKLFKLKLRWRCTFSNMSLSKTMIKNTNSHGKKSLYSIKKINVVRNMDVKDFVHPIIGIIAFSSNQCSKLNRLIIRGISSYGFDVVNLKIRFKHIQYDLHEEKIQYHIKELINSLNMRLQTNGIIINSFLMLYNTKSNPLALKIFLEDKNNLMIFINPDLTKFYRKTILRFLFDEEVNQNCLIIFSKNKLSVFSNKNLKKFLKLMPDYEKRNLNVKIIENSRKSFKYYETILLGKIIEFIDSYM